jgi:hypothetical protein
MCCNVCGWPAAHVVVLAKSLVLWFLDCLMGMCAATGTAAALLAALFILAFNYTCLCPELLDQQVCVQHLFFWRFLWGWCRPRWGALLRQSVFLVIVATFVACSHRVTPSSRAAGPSTLFNALSVALGLSNSVFDRFVCCCSDTSANLGRTCGHTSMTCFVCAARRPAGCFACDSPSPCCC